MYWAEHHESSKNPILLCHSRTDPPILQQVARIYVRFVRVPITCFLVTYLRVNMLMIALGMCLIKIYVLYVYLLLISPMIVLPIMYVLLRAVMLNTPGLIVNNPIYGGDVLGRTPRKFQKPNPSLPFKDRSSNFTTSSQNICSFCKGTHNLCSCDVFKSKHVNDRIRYVSDKKIMFCMFISCSYHR